MRHPLSPSRRGVTLIEAMLFISVALGLIAGGLVFFQQASLAARTQEAVRQFSAIVAETRGLFQSQVFSQQVQASFVFGPGADIMPVLIAAQAVPPSSVSSATTLQNPWGGTTTVFGSRLIFSTANVVMIRSENVPREACTRLLAASVSDAEGAVNTWNSGVSRDNVIATRMVVVGVGSSATPNILGRTYSPAQAGTACRYGSAALGMSATSTVPSSTPELGGSVTIVVGYLLN